jgi:nucleoid-associated protein YgaU
MNRENKLALVVGFGLILLVGILISDHFSAAQTQKPAALALAVEPLDSSRWSNPDLIAYRQSSTTPPQVTMPEEDAAATPAEPEPAEPAPATLPRPDTDGPGEEAMAAEANVTLPPDPGPVVDDPMTAPPPRMHVVREGETLTSICRDELGDADRVFEVAGLNDLENPDAVIVGQRLVLPDGAAPADPPTPSTYTVREGDNLSTIALRVLGSARRYDELFEANRDKLKTPDHVREGMVLRIPRTDDVTS